MLTEHGSKGASGKRALYAFDRIFQLNVITIITIDRMQACWPAAFIIRLAVNGKVDHGLKGNGPGLTLDFQYVFVNKTPHSAKGMSVKKFKLEASKMVEKSV